VPARVVRSKIDVLRVTIDGSNGGSAYMYWRPCNAGWIASPKSTRPVIAVDADLSRNDQCEIDAHEKLQSIRFVPVSGISGALPQFT